MAAFNISYSLFNKRYECLRLRFNFEQSYRYLQPLSKDFRVINYLPQGQLKLTLLKLLLSYFQQLKVLDSIINLDQYP